MRLLHAGFTSMVISSPGFRLSRKLGLVSICVAMPIETHVLMEAQGLPYFAVPNGGSVSDLAFWS